MNFTQPPPNYMTQWHPASSNANANNNKYTLRPPEKINFSPTESNVKCYSVDANQKYHVSNTSHQFTDRQVVVSAFEDGSSTNRNCKGQCYPPRLNEIINTMPPISHQKNIYHPPTTQMVQGKVCSSASTFAPPNEIPHRKVANIQSHQPRYVESSTLTNNNEQHSIPYESQTAIPIIYPNASHQGTMVNIAMNKPSQNDLGELNHQQQSFHKENTAGLIMSSPNGLASNPLVNQSGGLAIYSQHATQSVQYFTQPPSQSPPNNQGAHVPIFPTQIVIQGISSGHPHFYSAPQVVPNLLPQQVPGVPSSANIGNTHFPPPGLCSQPPPNYCTYSQDPRQATTDNITSPKTPNTNSPFANPSINNLVPVLPISSGPSTDYVSYVSQDAAIPDLRHEFLTKQFLPRAGQVVLLPPLPPDRSIQTIQLLTPGPSGQFSAQTIVLPIIKVENTRQMQQESFTQDKKAPDVMDNILEAKEKIIIKEEDENILLNEVDSIGLPKVMQGIDLEEVKTFAAEFKSIRLKLGLTQTQVGQALTNNNYDDGVAVSQSTICRFEKLEITALQVKKLLPALKNWIQDVKEREKQGLPVFVQDSGDGKDNKKRKKRTVFNQDTVKELCFEFELQPSPSSQQLSQIAEKMGLDKETVRVWFCNRRQNLKKSAS